MLFEPLTIPGAHRIRAEPKRDERGYFVRTFCTEEFAANGLVTNFVQRSASFNTRRGTLRGMHFQADPHAETKIVRCVRGRIFDVIVDLRQSSPTYGQWHAEELSDDNLVMLYIPPGCAHGFQTLEPDCEVYYEITPEYVPAAARGIRFDDPALAISWPLAEPFVSDRDRSLPLLSEIDRT